jgi:hypothetical protein
LPSPCKHETIEAHDEAIKLDQNYAQSGNNNENALEAFSMYTENQPAFAGAWSGGLHRSPAAHGLFAGSLKECTYMTVVSLWAAWQNQHGYKSPQNTERLELTCEGRPMGKDGIYHDQAYSHVQAQRKGRGQG